MLEPDYWQKQGVRTGKVSQWARYTKQWYDWEQELCRKNGKLFGIYETTKPVLYLSDPELIREVLVKDFHVFNNRRVNTIFESIYYLCKNKYQI